MNTQRGRTPHKPERVTIMMKSVDLKNAVRDNAARMFIAANPEALMSNEKPYTFYIPIEIEGEGTFWAKCGFTCAQMADTKSRPGFDPENDATPAHEAFENMIVEREANKAAAEAKKKEKMKNKTKKDEDEE